MSLQLQSTWKALGEISGVHKKTNMLIHPFFSYLWLGYNCFLDIDVCQNFTYSPSQPIDDDYHVHILI